ncbi:uncharacterized protein LOC126666170 [Mercurialis annua]|uniref:uncharacterized protein LOC126666170 n=1 Tax=Mercurialis annua TaxID=3986 RepID=UPI002160FD09|nr:uncharacterized protein LOC126666170 [Mercurialis annua]
MGCTEFVAVQCCQCATMQAKQKKKSSNKWTCVVCNQRQSVTKMFAQSFMAKDIRMFVQSFNMSRGKLAEHNDSGAGDAETLTADPQIQRKRRSDWTEYLDFDQDSAKQEQFEEQQGDDFGVKIVTELTKEMFKKPKFRNYDSRGNACHGFKPTFSKRNTSSKNVCSQGKEEKKNASEDVISPTKWRDYMKKDCEEQRKNQPTMATKASKWNDYITHDDSDFNAERRRNCADDMGHCSNDVWETILDEQKVEDDIHPDFI